MHDLLLNVISSLVALATSLSGLNSGAVLLALGPNITNVRADAITYSSARISWDTDAITEKYIEYGLTNSYGGVASDWSKSNQNVWFITGLTPATTYHYRVRATDSRGISYSPDQTFTTLSKSGTDPNLPELPRSYVDTSMPVQTGITRTVDSTCSNLQNLIDVSLFGDTIVIPAGRICTGNFTFPYKSGNGWIVVKGGGALPSPGNRITPSQSSQLGKIQTSNVNSPAVRISDNAHHYRFIGLEISPASAGNYRESMVDILSTAHHIIFDRVYVHGLDYPNRTQRGIRLNGNNTAIIDSYFDKLQWWDTSCLDSQGYEHCYGEEAYAIIVDAGGPGKILNNYIDAVGISMFWTNNSENLPIQDFEIRGNLLTVSDKYRYHSNNPLSDGHRYAHRQSLELKKGERFLIDGNIFEKSFCDLVSAGEVLVFSPRPGNTRLSNSIISDITVTNNIIRNASGGISIGGHSDGESASSQGKLAQRFKVSNNLLYGIDGYTYASNVQKACRGIALRVVLGAEDVTYTHNTVYDNKGTGPAILVSDNVPNTGLKYTDNISWLNNDSGIGGVRNGDFRGIAALNAGWQKFPGGISWQFQKNAIVNKAGINTSAYPIGNFWPTSGESVGFTDILNKNFALSSNSSYRNIGTDGRDLGISAEALNSATRNTLNGQTSSQTSPMPSPSPTPPQPTPSPMPPTVTPFTPIRINSGGPSYTDSQGRVWDADRGYSKGIAYSTNSAVSATSDASLLQNERWYYEPFEYTFHVSEGSYNVSLKFAEIFFGTEIPGGAGSRVFDILINNKKVASGFDKVAEAGGVNKAVDKNYLINSVGGNIVIRFERQVDNPTISALEITRKSILGDINADKIINSLDFSILNRNMNQTNQALDLNSDGVVNSTDSSIIFNNWYKKGE